MTGTGKFSSNCFFFLLFLFTNFLKSQLTFSIILCQFLGHSTVTLQSILYGVSPRYFQSRLLLSFRKCFALWLFPPKNKLIFFKRIIYIVRIPKDTAASLFHYDRESPNLPGAETWAAFLELFPRGDGKYNNDFYS